MIKLFRFVFFLLLSAATVVAAATNENPMQVRVDLQNKSAFQIIEQGHFDIMSISKAGFVDIAANDNDYKRLIDAGLNPIIIHEDLVSFYQSRFPAGATMGGYRTMSECYALMDSLHTLYPNITTARDSIGHTYQGRALYIMKISDNPNQDEDEPEFFVNGLIHAREPMGMEATIRFAQYLCQQYGSDSVITNLVNNREIYFLPIFNPDGYEYNRQTYPGGGGMWRKNLHGDGIDLNRNWGYQWGYDNIGSSPYSYDETYRGSAPFSEPETQALREFIDSRHFSVIMNFHAYANDFLYPWGYADIHAPDQQLFAVIADSVTAANGYAPGTPWELMYNTNGDSNDWQYGEQSEKPKIFGFTIEIGNDYDGFWPDPSRITTLWGEVLPSLMYLAKIASNPYGVDAPAAPSLNPIGDIFGNSFTVRWSSHDTLNPAIAFELKELIGLQRITDNYDVNTDNWTLHNFARSTIRRHSGSYSIFSGAQNNYTATAELNNPITVSPNDTLKFWTWYDIEPDWDYAYVQLSTNGGATFVNLPGNITTNSNPNGTNQGNGITGSSNAWIQASFPLNSYAGQSVIFNILYRTDTYTLGEGFYADDFYPVESFQQQNVLNSNIADTFFVVSGRGEGNYYYQVRGKDAEGQWSAFSNREMAIVHPGPSCVYVPGDANGNGAANGVDIVYGVNYFKGNGQPPPDSCDCPPHGRVFAGADANGNCTYNGIDITYLVNFLKGFGSPPQGCLDCTAGRQ